ncbi:MAG: alpha/beta fold hydrolase [Ectothiorhodospiraceae bacterium]|nr:alpha/beta fold hydrolase [Ectothiorhodospiraceae bacterium]
MNTVAESPTRVETSPELIQYLTSSPALAPALPEPVPLLLDRIEDVWLDHRGVRIHLDFHRAESARGVVVLQPGSCSYARFYCVLAARLASAGYHVLGIDRPGHGFSEGVRGDCSIEEALDVTEAVLAHARERFDLPVILLGSSLGGLLTGFAVMRGLQPDLAIAHNFIISGRLVSFRLRARLIERYRRRPYRLVDLTHGLKGFGGDPALLAYLKAEADPQAAWLQSPRAMASLFRHNPKRPKEATPPLVVLSGTADKLIPGWASRFFLRWSGVRNSEYIAIPDAGHMLFHDHLEQAMPVLLRLLDGAVTRR